MSERVRAKRPASSPAAKSPAKAPVSPKAARRAEWKRVAAERAAARRRRNALLGALGAGVAVALVIVLAFAVFDGSDDDNTPSATNSQVAGPQAGAAATQKLPDGFDPALGTKPKVTAGTGELSALKVTPIVEGKGATVQAGQTIKVNYVGVNYKTGAEFDSSWKRNEPAEFGIGTGQVIKGWDQGLVGVKVGSRVQLDIPANLAYGDQGDGATAGALRFVVDILEAK